MNAFAAAVGMMFRDRNMSVAANYRPGGGAIAATPRIMLSRPDVTSEWNGGQLVRDSIRIDVQIADVSDLEKGDRFELLDETGAVTETLEIMADPERDTERLIWQATARSL